MLVLLIIIVKLTIIIIIKIIKLTTIIIIIIIITVHFEREQKHRSLFKNFILKSGRYLNVHGRIIFKNPPPKNKIKQKQK